MIQNKFVYKYKKSRANKIKITLTSYSVIQRIVKEFDYNFHYLENINETIINNSLKRNYLLLIKGQAANVENINQYKSLVYFIIEISYNFN